MATSTPTQTASVQQAVEAIIDASIHAKSRRAFLSRAAGILCESADGLAVRVEVMEQAVVVQAEAAREGQAHDFWDAPLKALMDDCVSAGEVQVERFNGKQTGVGVALYALPLRTSRGAGSLAIAMPCRNERQAAAQLERIETYTTLITLQYESVDESKPKAKAEGDGEAAAQALRRAADFESTVQLAMTVTNRLASKEGFDQVALGRVRGKRVKLLAVSGLDHVDAKSESIGYIEQAMQECFDFGAILVQQSEPIEADPPFESGHLHQKWFEATRSAPVATIPLTNADGVVAVLALVRTKKAPLDAEELFAIQKMVVPFGAALPVIERATQSVTAHVFDSVVAAPMRFFSRHHIGRKLVFCSFALFAAWSWFGRLPYRVTAETELAPRAVRAVGAPVDAPLAEAPFAPGMPVQAGDVLARFDTAALGLEAKRLNAEIAIKEFESNLAIAEGSPVDIQLAGASLTELRANLDIVEHEIQMATIVAPLDGILIEGDLRERIGDRFSKGEPLFRIAAGTGYTLELFIDESDVDDVTGTEPGHFATFARPEVDFPLTVTRVAPAAEKRGDINTFRVEAQIDVDAPWLRSGMQGVARIDAGERRPLWIWTHEIIDHLRMKSWL